MISGIFRIVQLRRTVPSCILSHLRSILNGCLLRSEVSSHAAGRDNNFRAFSFFRSEKENDMILLNNTSCLKKNEEKNQAAAMSRFLAAEQLKTMSDIDIALSPE
ncbi:hypothetical protein [Candidatus Electronema sp. TJ]|uniref:hypothetical protein n=1 Tax=Candidatus Electronema sp. TJ TaxID=3401573 RepID=UPI003AA85638